MATYTKVPLSVPSSQRSMLITDVVSGDQIDVEAILGRPAQSVIITPADSTDVITYRLNNLKHIKVNKHMFDGDSPQFVDVWSRSPVFPTYSSSGGTVYEIVADLAVTSIEIDTITFGAAGTSIEIVVS